MMQFSQYPLIALSCQVTNRTFQRVFLQLPAHTFKQTLDLESVTEWIRTHGEKPTQNQRKKPCLKQTDKEQASLTDVKQVLPHIYS